MKPWVQSPALNRAGMVLHTRPQHWEVELESSTATKGRPTGQKAGRVGRRWKEPY